MMENRDENIDNVHRVLLATGAINYMAHTILSVQKELICVAPTAKEITGIELETPQRCDELFKSVIRKLSEALNELGDFMNNNDMTMPEDEKATKRAFKVLNHNL